MNQFRQELPNHVVNHGDCGVKRMEITGYDYIDPVLTLAVPCCMNLRSQDGFGHQIQGRVDAGTANIV